ncbi:hypothetical protein GOP47_0005835 [Adiantum capillus-veneris]|uniref:Cytochrome P450 n=1 Tax=Adiantum capillus-veneris TaxID=13818 RepID=A0A9D4V5T4_ADICA|nr:hypothetical protein GOP47_0005835 [Adiantum capillus-veneris]
MNYGDMASDEMRLLLSRLHPYQNVAVAVLAAAVVWAALSVVLVLGSRRRKLPPGPRAWPLIGNLHLLGAMPHQSLAKLAQNYGPLMSIWLGSYLYVVASTPEMAKALLQTHDSTFASRPSIAATVHMLFHNSDMAFALYGPYWKLIRRVCLTHIFHPRRLDSFSPIRLQEARDLLRNINRSCSYGGSPVPVRLRLQEAANNIISRIALNKKYTELSSAGSTHDLIALIDETMLLLGVPNIGDFIPSLAWMDLQGWERRMKVVGAKVQQAMGEIIKQRRAERLSGLPAADRPHIDQQDLLDVLLAAASEEKEEQITDDNITAVIMDMYLGGTGTIAITAEWAMAELLRNPEVLKKAQDEIDMVVGRERLVEDEDVQEKLPYLRAVLKETFRLHPVAPLLLPRESMQACTVGGYQLPARTRAYVNVYAVGRDPGTWEEPLAFRPERFVGSDVEENGQQFQLLPFGAGRRRCIALELGLLNLRLFLARLLQAFEWSPAAAHAERLDMSELFGLNVMLAQPLTAHVSPRVSPTLYM